MISEIADIVLLLKSFSARLNLRSFGIILITTACLFTGVDLIAQTGPGGVGNSSNNLLWLKADAGTSTTVDGNPVTSWLDQSGNAMNATQGVATRQPKYVASGSNSKPSILLNNDGDGIYDYLNLPSGFSDFTGGLSAFVVVNPNSTVAWSNFFNLGGGTPPSNDAIAFSRDDISANIWYQVVANGASSNISRSSISDGFYQILNVRQDPGVPPGTSTVRIYKNNNFIPGSALVNIPRNVLRNDNYIGHDS